MPDFHQDRFDALVLYIAHHTRNDATFGRVKLAKVLFYCDFTAYREEGASLTGATYIRLPKGPFPRALPEAEARLQRAGLARLDHDVPEYEEKRIVALRGADRATNLFEPWQLAFVNIWIDEISAASARRTSDRSHEHSGWILADHTGVEIPYATAFLPEGPPTAVDLARARRVARERGWLTDDGWTWERESA